MKIDKLKHDQLILIVSVSAIIAVSIAVVSAIYYQGRYTALQSDYDQFKSGFTMETYPLGLPIETLEFTLLINSVDIDREGIPGYLPVEDGMQYLAVDITLTNKTDTEDVFIPLNETYLRDSDGNKYELTTVPNVEIGAAGRVVAGDTIKGQLGFYTPIDARELRFYYEPYSANSQTVVIDLGL